MNTKQRITAKLNETREPDTKPFSWRTIPKSLRLFWLNYFKNQKKVH